MKPDVDVKLLPAWLIVTVDITLLVKSTSAVAPVLAPVLVRIDTP